MKETPAKTHGESKTRLYCTWQNMKARCYRKSAREYENYGGRGISVCAEWKNDYIAFRDWSLSHGYDANAPHGECTLDRIDVDGDYCPSNCRWISNFEQQSNRRDNVYATHNNQTLTVAQWARALGVSEKTLRQRIDRWGVERAIETPISHDRRMNLIGQKFGRLYVLSRAEKPDVKNKSSYFACICDCGNQVVVQGRSLVKGLTQSCGCLMRETHSVRMREIMANKPRTYKYMAVLCKTPDGAIVAEYKNVPEAAAAIGVRNTLIYRVINNPARTCRGMKWESKELNCAR